MRNFYKTGSFLLMLMVGLSGCLKDRHKERLEEELVILNEYLQTNDITVQPTSAGLYYVEQQSGIGGLPENGDYLLFSYTGRLLENGKIFATSNAQLAEENELFNSTALYGPYKMQYGFISPYGIHEGLKFMREGSTARLIFPSTLGFGTTPLVGIPPYSSLIYDVELLKIIPDPVEYETEKIDAFIAQNQYIVLPDSAGLYYIETSAGTGELPSPTARVDVAYEARLIDGREISSTGEGVRTFTLYSEYQISGLKEGIKKMKTGGRAIIIVPYNLGFGANTINDIGYGYKTPIPPYSTIVFDIELKAIYE